MAGFSTLDDIDLGGRTVLLRCDLNVPLEHGSVSDDFRIRAALPTIRRLQDAGAAIVVCSHLGRPTGRDPELSMGPVAVRLSELGGFEVVTPGEVIGPRARQAASSAGPGDVVVLENTRFEIGETANDPEFARHLAGLAQVFVLDAFGSAHRAHASTVGVADHLQSVAGPLLVAELEALSRLVSDPPRPFIVVLGGAKVGDKLPVMEALLPKVDIMLIGGGMCFTMLAAEGYDIGDSLVEPDLIDSVRGVLDGEHGGKITIPSDLVVGDRFDPDADHQVVAAKRIEDGWMGLDIGPETSALFASVIAGSGSVFWNGPMGVFEWEAFRAGTAAVADAVAKSSAFTVAGGGDSVAALRLFGIENELSHLSTGGGAGLELLEGKILPGVAALERWA